MLFDDLKEGDVFVYIDSRMSESETWIPFVKTGLNQAAILAVAGSNRKEFIDNNCIGYRVSKDVRMDSTQYKEQK